MAVLAVACSHDDTQPAPTPKTEQVTISFTAESPVAVNGARSSSGSGFDYTLAPYPVSRHSDYDDTWESDYTSVMVLQFIDGRLALDPYITHNTKTETVNGKTIYSLYVPIVTDNSKTSTIYIFANYPDELTPQNFNYKNYTADEFQNKLLEVTHESLLDYDYKNMMIGTYTGKTGSSIKIHASLKRILSRLRFKLNVSATYAEKLKFTSIQVKSVPRHILLNVTDPDPNRLYPETAESNFMDFNAYFSTEDHPIDNTTAVAWYMPENLRGINTGIHAQQDKVKENDPALVGGKSLSTHLVLRGTYNDGSNTSLFTITLYPGGNTVNDFYVKRNISHDMLLSINNFDHASDQRIQIEEGPFVEYQYFYREYNGWGDYRHFATDYVTGYTVGQQIQPSLEILNKFHNFLKEEGLIYQYATLMDGYLDAGDGSATQVGSDNSKNIVKIYCEPEYY